MIKLEKVNKYFNNHKKNEIHVINNTSLELPDSGMVALLGPSGCGKTTLLNVIGGLDKVKKGKIYINDKKITKKSMHYVDKVRNLNIGYVFQNFYLLDNQTVFDNVALSLKMIGIKDKKEIKQRVNFVLETLGIYRYRTKLASMLSGGERQRVAIARAIVKNPSIILADEPTGNLDSANTIEIMNILKAISKNRLVILVTHENNLAKFYADRIIEIEDGCIKKDYENNHNDSLDYRVDNKFYLKDFKYHTEFNNKDNEVDIYNDLQNDLKLTIVVKGNNIYIKGSKNNNIEVIDNSSNIEFINDHYKQIDKSVYEKYEFNLEENKHPLKYSSTISLWGLLKKGFIKILDYSIIKKILLLGFLASGAFIAYSVSNLMGITKISDSDFIKTNHNYYVVEDKKINNKDYDNYEHLASVDYILPGDSNVSFLLNFRNYYQTNDAKALMSGSIVSLEHISSNDLIMGRMPQNKWEIVVDKMVLDNLLKNSYVPKEAGIKSVEELLNIKASVNNMNNFTVVGVIDKEDPSIYTYKEMMLSIILNSKNKEYDNPYKYYDENSDVKEKLADYSLFDNLNLIKGKLPEKDYEVIVNINKELEYPINSQIVIDSLYDKTNKKKLTVVGYYENDFNLFIVNSTMIKYSLINQKLGLTIYPQDKETIEREFNELGLHIKNSYEYNLKEYKDTRAESVKAGVIVCLIILGISFIEIYFMVRASFLSRIKEVGILRAIGVKKRDVYKMFFGEIFCITTIACVPGVLLMNYALSILSSIPYFSQNYVVSLNSIMISIILIYIFNIIVGLLPVMRVVKDTPAKILARKELD